jgi:hypothetical protein
MFGSRDRDGSVDQSSGQFAQQSRPLLVAQGGRSADVVAQFDPTVGGVDRLPARARRTAEPLDQFGRRHDQASR